MLDGLPMDSTVSKHVKINESSGKSHSIDGDALLNFLLHPENDHHAVEERLTAFTHDELDALDQYLYGQAGGKWLEVKEFHHLPIGNGSWRSLWSSRVACRLLLLEKERGNPDWMDFLHLSSDPLRLQSFEVPRTESRHVVVSSGFLEIELTRSYHPSITGSRLFCESPTLDRLTELTSRYRQALGLLDRQDPQGFAVFSGSVSAIAPLQLDPPLEPGRCVSMSIAAAPGIVLLTMIPIILLSETLLHEAAHCRLSAAEDLAPLWVSNGVRVASPLRPDPRPIAGLYHQAYVLYWLSRYFRCLHGATEEPVVQRNRLQIDKRIDELTAGFRTAVATLRENRRELTPLGERLVEAMAFGEAR
jgi:hypothetical protein